MCVGSFLSTHNFHAETSKHSEGIRLPFVIVPSTGKVSFHLCEGRSGGMNDATASTLFPFVPHATLEIPRHNGAS